jgi:hypothetical protein
MRRAFILPQDSWRETDFSGGFFAKDFILIDLSGTPAGRILQFMSSEERFAKSNEQGVSS